MAPGARVSLADQAYLAVREDVLRGQLRPGTPLSRRRLARDLGMSVAEVTGQICALAAPEWRERRGSRRGPVEVPPGG